MQPNHGLKVESHQEMFVRIVTCYSSYCLRGFAVDLSWTADGLRIVEALKCFTTPSHPLLRSQPKLRLVATTIASMQTSAVVHASSSGVPLHGRPIGQCENQCEAGAIREQRCSG